MSALVGVRDRPIEHRDDEDLGLTPYADSLATFVAECDTPMTVGLQGEWGTGKTSLMNMIRGSLQDRGVPTVWVDTWAYAQLHDGDTLALAVLRGVVEALGERTQMTAGRAARQGIGWIRSQLVTAAKVTVAARGGDLGAVIDAPESERGGIEVARLKVEIAKLVDAATGGSGRLALFVDDLDRVRPDRAVRLLEALKNFLDLPGLVTVLACDYGVVKQGLGVLMGVDEDTLGRSFFDKIIQVPFRMPESRYRYRQYLSRLLSSIGVEAAEGEIDLVKDVLAPSVGLNPRALKRLVNSLQLLLSVARATQTNLLDRPRAPLLLLALVAIETKWGDVADHLLTLARNQAREELRVLLEGGQSRDDNLEAALRERLARPEVRRTLDALEDLVDVDENEVLDWDELKTLEGLLKLTALNSLRAPTEEPETSHAQRIEGGVTEASRAAWSRMDAWLAESGFEVKVRGSDVEYRRRVWSSERRRAVNRAVFALSYEGPALQVRARVDRLREVAERHARGHEIDALLAEATKLGEVRREGVLDLTQETAARTWGSLKKALGGRTDEVEPGPAEVVVVFEPDRKVGIEFAAESLLPLLEQELAALFALDWALPPG